MSLRAITRDEVERWLASRALTRPQARFDHTQFQSEIRFSVPETVWGQQQLSRIIVDLVCTPGEGLFWAAESGVWQCENRFLLDAFRAFVGESRAILEAPGFIFSEVDRDAIEALLILTLSADHDAVIVSGDERLVVTTDHHDFAEFYARDSAQVATIGEALESWFPGWQEAQRARHEAELAKILDEINKSRTP